ncbi:hypothetical protein BGZ76_001356, partial [Entomortierella beljakovae]
TSQPASGFGAATGGFGAATATPSLFGSNPAGATGAFGAPAASTAGGFGGFGQTQTSAAPASTGLGFGLGAAPAGFGAAKPPTSSLFGAPAPATSAAPSFGGFGAPSAGAGGLFGGAASGSSLFPATSTASTGLFGGAGATAAPAFGAAGASSNLFGAKPATTGGLFAPAATSAFGSTPGFGTAGAAQSSLFGGAGTAGSTFGTSTLGNSFLGQSTNTAAAQPSMVASVNSNIYGDNPLFQRDTTTPASKPKPAVLSRSEPAQKLPALIPPVRFNPRHTQIRLRPTSTATFSSNIAGGDLPAGRKSLLLLEGIHDDYALASDEYTSRRSVKKLQLKPRGPESDQSAHYSNHLPKSGVTFNPNLETAAAESLSGLQSSMERSSSLNGKSTENQTHSSGHESLHLGQANTEDRIEGEYWMSPSLEDLRKMPRSQLQQVRDFKVGLPGYGSVSFLEPVDLSTVSSLSSICGHIVLFRPRICIVYPDENNKPPRGQGLNVPALISLENCWPLDKSTREPIKVDKSSPQYAQHLKRLKRQAETTFVEFNADDGAWTFRVEHFSKYGLEDDEFDDIVTSQDDHRITLPSKHASSSGISSSRKFVNDAKHFSESSNLNGPSSSVSRLPKSRDPQRQNTLRNMLFDESHPSQDRLSKRSSAWSTSEHAEQAVSGEGNTVGFGAEVRSSFQQAYGSNGSTLRRPPRKFTRLVYEQSLLNRKGNLLADAGLMMGRSCRVGWGPGGLLTVCGTLCGFRDVKERADKTLKSDTQTTQNDSPTTIKLLKVKVVKDSESAEIQRHITSMQTLLSNSTLTLNDSNEPRANIVPGTTFTTLMGCLKELNHNLSAQEVYAWILGQSLFDPQPTPPNMSEMPKIAQDSYECIGRRSRCSNWLSYAIKPSVEAKIRQINSGMDQSEKEDVLFSLMASNKRQMASVAAVQLKNIRLATLISQSGRSSQPLLGLENQMRLYKDLGVEGKIPVGYSKVFALLSGALDVNIAPKGGPPVYVTDGLDWQQTFGLFLWYSNIPGANLQQAVDHYTTSMATRRSVARPTPWYQKSGQNDDENSERFDFLFQLIVQSTLPSRSLEDALHPLGISPSILDYRQSWLFYMVLSQSLKVGRFRTDSSHARICHNFIFQLESLGLWEWAVFVALHLETDVARETTVRYLLERYVDLPAQSDTFIPAEELVKWEIESKKESFVKDTLQVPETWIWRARAIRAKYRGELFLEVFSLLKAGEHQKAHNLTMSSLAPVCILGRDLGTLSRLLGMFDQSKASGWGTGGSIYQRYTECCSDFEGRDRQLKVKSRLTFENDLVPREDIQALQDEIQSLLTKLPLLLTHQTDDFPRLRACVEEMASKCTSLLRDLKDLSIQEGVSLAGLPLNEDERTNTVQKISSDYFDEILKFAETSAY